MLKVPLEGRWLQQLQPHQGAAEQKACQGLRRYLSDTELVVLATCKAAPSLELSPGGLLKQMYSTQWHLFPRDVRMTASSPHK